MAESTVAYKCPNCKAPLSFKPGADKVNCEYCGTEIDIATMEAMFEKEQERAAKAQAEKEAKWATEDAGGQFTAEETEMMRQFTCSACGAALVADGNTMATECVYCGNPTMVPSRFDGMIKPDYVIPFKKDKKDAVAALKKFYEGKILLPNAFKSNNRVQDIQSMYVPFWLFDAEVTASAVFEAEEDHVTETEDERIIETAHYDCSREGCMSFTRIPVDGSDKMDDDYMDSIAPFDYSDMVEFSAAYLTGYLADKYDVDAEASVPRADERIENSAVGQLRNTVTGYDRVSEKEHYIVKDNGSVSYAMVPVWILTTKYEKKPYTFMMNGQTGKVVGSLPYDKTKALLYPGAAGIVLLPIVYFLAKALIDKPSSGMLWGIAIVGAIIGAVLVRMGLMAQLSNVAHETHADHYLDEGSFNLTERDDTYLYTTTRVERKSKKNDD